MGMAFTLSFCFWLGVHFSDTFRWSLSAALCVAFAFLGVSCITSLTCSWIPASATWVGGGVKYENIAIRLGADETLFCSVRERLVETCLWKDPMHLYWDVLR